MRNRVARLLFIPNLKNQEFEYLDAKNRDLGTKSKWGGGGEISSPI